MFTFNNNSISGSYSMRPKKDKNPVDFININNDNFNENSNILNVDLKTIHFENISVELALNVLQLKHNIYYEMTHQDIIQYYNEKIKLNNNMNTILALKIILKYKFKDLNVSNNKLNNISITDNKLDKNDYKDNFYNKKLIEQKNKTSNDSIIHNEFSIIQNGKKKTNYDDFKIIQTDTKQINTKQINTNTNTNINVLLKNNSQINILDNRNHNLKDTSNNSIYDHIVSINQKKSDNKIQYVNIDQQHNIHQQYNIHQQTNVHQQNNVHNKSTSQLNYNSSEKYNGLQVTKSSEFDIDSIINSYSQKKTNGLVK